MILPAVFETAVPAEEASGRPGRSWQPHEIEPPIDDDCLVSVDGRCFDPRRVVGSRPAPR